MWSVIRCFLFCMMHRFCLVLRFFRGLKALYLLSKERDPLFKIIIDYRDLWFLISAPISLI